MAASFGCPSFHGTNGAAQLQHGGWGDGKRFHSETEEKAQHQWIGGRVSADDSGDTSIFRGKDGTPN